MAENRVLSGKTALVTGGAKRLGRGIALALARAGCDVAITYRASATEAEQTRAELAALDVRALAVDCQLREEASVRAAVRWTIEEFGRLDLVVNNAGVFENVPLEELSLEQWDAVFETNTRGPFLVAREAVAALRASRGRILNIGSLGGLRPWGSHAHYCASKAALHMLTQSMAKAWAPEISVNCIAPGWILVDEDPAGLPAHFAAKTPMQRNGTVEEIAAAALFFATGPHFITGQILAVDGGLGL